MTNILVDSKDYRWIVLEVLIQSLLYFVTNLQGGMPRLKLYNKEYMEQFRNEFGDQEPPGGGAPDCGNGRFSTKLKLPEWIEYNTAQYLASHALQTYVGGVLLTFAIGLYSSSTGIAFGALLIVLRLVTNFLGKANPSNLSFLEPLNHLVVFIGLATASGLAYKNSK